MTKPKKDVKCGCGHVAKVHGCGQTLRCMPCMTKGKYCARFVSLRLLSARRNKTKRET